MPSSKSSSSLHCHLSSSTAAGPISGVCFVSNSCTSAGTVVAATDSDHWPMGSAVVAAIATAVASSSIVVGTSSFVATGKPFVASITAVAVATARRHSIAIATVFVAVVRIVVVVG